MSLKGQTIVPETFFSFITPFLGVHDVNCVSWIGPATSSSRTNSKEKQKKKMVERRRRLARDCTMDLASLRDG